MLRMNFKCSIPARNGCTCRFLDFPAGGFVARIWNCRRGLRLPLRQLPTDCVASGLSDWTNDGRGDEPAVPACPAGGEHLPGGLGASAGEAGEDSVALSDGHCAHQC